MSELVLALIGGDHKPKLPGQWYSVVSNGISTSTIWQISWQANKNSRTNDSDWQWHSLMMENKTLRPIALFFAKLSLIAENSTLEAMLDYIIGTEPLEIEEKDLDKYTSPYH